MKRESTLFSAGSISPMPQGTFPIPIPPSNIRMRLESQSHLLLFLPRPQFMAAYFDEPDHSGHQGGPFSDLVHTAGLHGLWCWCYAILIPCVYNIELMLCVTVHLPPPSSQGLSDSAFCIIHVPYSGKLWRSFNLAIWWSRYRSPN